MKIKFKNFCGMFATLFVTTTMVLLASCSQDDDNYDSDMYTLAEMGTRLGNRDEWNVDPLSPQKLRPGSVNDTVNLDGLDVVFTVSWSDTICMGDSVNITKLSDNSNIVIYCKDENGHSITVNKFEYVGHNFSSPAKPFRNLNTLSFYGLIYYKKAIVNPVTQVFEGWGNDSEPVTVKVGVGNYLIL